MNQCRISCVKYLGELYNYQLIESNVIFTVLYSLITFGNSDDGKIRCKFFKIFHSYGLKWITALIQIYNQHFHIKKTFTFSLSQHER